MSRCLVPSCACSCHTAPTPTPPPFRREDRDSTPPARVPTMVALARAELDARACPGCSRQIGRRGDGERKAHRVVADDPASAWCPSGGERQR